MLSALFMLFYGGEVAPDHWLFDEIAKLAIWITKIFPNNGINTNWNHISSSIWEKQLKFFKSTY